jgi:hypothetical protein
VSTQQDVRRRRGTVVHAVGLGLAILALPLLSSVPLGDGALRDASGHALCGAAPCDREESASTQDLVRVLTGNGLECGETPRRTDVVVVERADGTAEVASFGQALDVAAQRDGWLRAFCVQAPTAR